MLHLKDVEAESRVGGGWIFDVIIWLQRRVDPHSVWVFSTLSTVDTENVGDELHISSSQLMSRYLHESSWDHWSRAVESFNNLRRLFKEAGGLSGSSETCSAPGRLTASQIYFISVLQNVAIRNICAEGGVSSHTEVCRSKHKRWKCM